MHYYYTYIKIPVKKFNHYLLQKAINNFNSENNSQLSIIDYNDTPTISIKSLDYLTGYTSHFIAFSLGEYFQEVLNNIN